MDGVFIFLLLMVLSPHSLTFPCRSTKYRPAARMRPRLPMGMAIAMIVVMGKGEIVGIEYDQFQGCMQWLDGCAESAAARRINWGISSFQPKSLTPKIPHKPIIAFDGAIFTSPSPDLRKIKCRNCEENKWAELISTMISPSSSRPTI